MAIKTAGKKLGIADLKVSFVVVQKRHHIRFFPGEGEGDKNGNVFAGTVVNRDITHSREHEFSIILPNHSSVLRTFDIVYTYTYACASFITFNSFI